jgi:hypothetical protein
VNVIVDRVAKVNPLNGIEFLDLYAGVAGIDVAGHEV